MQPQKPQVDMSSTQEIKCEECESVFFNEAFYIRKASKLLTGSDQDTIIPIPTMRCADCGNVNQIFKPKGL